MKSIYEIKALQHLKKYRPLLYELIVRDLKIKYRRSFLGYLWSLLNPLLMMLVLNIVFSYVFRYDIPNFPLYLISGQTLWTFFHTSTNMAMCSILDNGALLKKIYIPKFIFPISRVLSGFVTLSFSLVAILLVMLGTRTKFYMPILLFPIPLLFLLVFSCGIGMMLAGLAVYFRDVMHLYSVVTLAWMYLTPIFYPISVVPEQAAVIIRNNPLYHYIDFFRELVLYGRVPLIREWYYCILSSATALIAGLIVFGRLQKKFILYI